MTAMEKIRLQEILVELRKREEYARLYELSAENVEDDYWNDGKKVGYHSAWELVDAYYREYAINERKEPWNE